MRFSVAMVRAWRSAAGALANGGARSSAGLHWGVRCSSVVCTSLCKSARQKECGHALSLYKAFAKEQHEWQCNDGRKEPSQWRSAQSGHHDQET